MACPESNLSKQHFLICAFTQTGWRIMGQSSLRANENERRMERKREERYWTFNRFITVKPVTTQHGLMEISVIGFHMIGSS